MDHLETQQKTLTVNFGTPATEHEIDDELVRALLRAQHPDLADAEIRLIDHGWDNAMYRLGEDYVVRLPRRRVAVPLIEHEQKWLPELARRLPIRIPAPMRVGRPGNGYPWPWSILPWLPGQTADLDFPTLHQAKRLAEFLRALHQPAAADAPKNDLRGVPLADRAPKVIDRFDRMSAIPGIITPELRRVWQQALEARVANKSCWLHGDLHARNVLVDNGVITGIIDWGDVTAGDAATDLACVWSLFPEPAARAECLEHYEPSAALLARAKGWAVFFGAVLLDSGRVDHPRHAAMGEAILRRVHEDG